MSNRIFFFFFLIAQPCRVVLSCCAFPAGDHTRGFSFGVVDASRPASFCSSSTATAQRSSDIRSLPRLLISYLSGLGSGATQHEKTAVLCRPRPPDSPFPTAKNTARLVSDNRRHPGVAWQREFSVSRFALRAAPLSSSRPRSFCLPVSTDRDTTGRR